MAYYSILKPPFDFFTRKLFYLSTHKYSKDLDCIYMWSAALDKIPEYREKHVTRLYNCLSEKNVILGIKDHLTQVNFNPWREAKPYHLVFLEKFFADHSHLKFILITSMENLEFYIRSKNVVSVIPWGGDITNQEIEYKLLDPVIEKNLNNPRFNFISLNRHNRTHRTALLSLLHYFKINHHGMVSCMYFDQLPNETKWWLDWRLDNELKKIYEEGYDILRDSRHSLLVGDPDIYKDRTPNDNVSNFKNVLTNLYRESFVEIISETSMAEKCFNLTEKTLNSIYGCNFPIWISSEGIVNFLRSMGLDVFDDIVDHSYDSIENPGERIFRAIKDNYNLLTSPNISEIWNANRPRFLKNIEFAKKDLYTFYENRFNNMFDESVKKIT